jgi:endonuclease YncB( thermonuclease family)
VPRRWPWTWSAPSVVDDHDGLDAGREDGESRRCGRQAALALSDAIGRSVVHGDPSDRDRYGHIVAICFKGALDLSRWVVDQGWAMTYRKYSLEYVAN